MLILISSQGHCLQLALASSEVFTDQLLPFYPWRNLTGFQQNLQIQWMYDSSFKTLILCNPASVQGEVRCKINCISLYFCSFFFFFLLFCTSIIWNLPPTFALLFQGVHCSWRTQNFPLRWAQKLLVIRWAAFYTPSPRFFFFFFLFPILLATTEKVDSNQIGWGR